MTGWREQISLAQVARWCAVGMGSMVFGLGLLFAMVDIARLPFPIATIINFCAITLIRYYMNARWVFGSRAFSWGEFRRYYGTLALTFSLWWVLSNALVLAGVHYLVAAVLSNVVSAGVTLMLNFIWVWRGKRPVERN